MDNIKELGRLKYIEPTNLTNETGYGYSEDITYPYEDYCMSVDLIIKKTNRYTCGWADKDDNEIRYSTSNGTISFLSGSKDSDDSEGFLTTKFTDVSMTNPGTNTSECLGIESITISYTDMLYPLVNIKFIDVRGATLMSPTEAGYYNNYQDEYLGGSRALYKAFFTMPYPIFELKVKGFYGEGANFKLALHKADIEFDSENGNFIISASFIGHLYGIFTDLPMTYIASAPFMSGGKEYWEEKVNDGTFMFRDAYGNKVHPMITFPELRKRISQVANDKKYLNNIKNNATDIGEIDNRLNELKTLKESFPFTEENGWYFGSLKDSAQKLILNKDEALKLKTELYNYYKTAESYSIKKGDKRILNYFKFLSGINDNSIDKYFNDKPIKKGEYDNLPANQKNLHGDYITFVNKSFDKYNATEMFTFSIDFKNIKISDIIQYFNNEISFLERRKTKIENEYKEKELSIIEELIKFRPSIRNIYNLAFAHMQTFMHCFYEHTHLIKNEIKNNEDARKKSYHYIDDEYTDTERSVIDVGGSILLNNYLPPYAAFYVDRTNSNNQSSNQGKEIAWPERIGGVHAEKLQEVHFINSLLTGSETYKEVTTNLNIDSISSGSSIIEGIDTEINGFIPVTVYDFACKDNIINPYIKAKEAINMGEENTLEAVILSTFALRAFYANKVSSKHSDVIGCVEALNLFNALKTNNSISFVKFIKKYLTGNIGTSWVAFRDLITETTKNNINSLWIGNNKTPLFTLSSYNTRTLNNYQVTNNCLIYSYNDTIFPIGTTDFKQINSDINNKVDNDRKYYYFKSGDTNNSFIIINSSDYIQSIYNNAEESFNAYNSDYYDSYKTILNTEIDDELYYFEDNIIDKENSVLESTPINKGKRVLKTIIEENKNDDFSNYFIKHPSIVITEGIWKPISFFEHKVYEDNKENIEAIAYFFLLSVPILSHEFNKGHISRSNKNGLVSKLLLLREGAYYWYLDNFNNEGEFQDNKIKIDGYNIAGQDEEYFTTPEIKNSNYTDNFIFYTGETRTYNKWVKPDKCTLSRQEYLKNYFVEWANDESDLGFKSNLNRLTSKDYLYVEGNYSKGLKSTFETDNAKKESEILQKFLKDLFFGLVTIFDLNNISLTNESILTHQSSDIQISFENFLNTLKTLYGKYFEDTESENQVANNLGAVDKSHHFRNDDTKLSIYLSLKSLYDKWLCHPYYNPNNSGGHWGVNTNNFIYTDSFYHDIGDTFIINITKVANWLASCLPSSMSDTNTMGYTGKCVYNFLAEIAQDSGALLLAIPQKFGEYDSERLANMFKAMPLYSNWDNDDNCSFVFMYIYKPSEHLGTLDDNVLDMNGYDPCGDGVDLTNDDIMGNIVNDNGYVMPAFGVTYAKQNQSFFKNIRLSTVAGITSDVALAATQNIASKASHNPNESYLYGQDIYKIYNNKSYSCEVEMLGNIQIMPLMYFQLNNIPLWKGGYQIKKVTHNITAGNFVTKFEGQRINKYAIPIGNGVSYNFPLYNLSKDDNNEIINNNINKSDTKRRNIVIDESKPVIKQMSTSEYEKTLDNIDVCNDTIGKEYTLPKYVGKRFYNEDNVSEKKPLICITPAHGPKTEKSREWEWSNKLVEKMYNILTGYTYSDNTHYNVHRCNIKGNNTSTKYSMKETKALIKYHGSKSVISVVPHWNGGGQQRYEIFLNWVNNERPDSVILAKKMRESVFKTLNSASFGEYSNCVIDRSSGEFKVNILPLNWYFTKNDGQDGAPRLNCACILTENWYADCDRTSNLGPSKYERNENMGDLFYTWLTSDYGIETVAKMHAEAIKSYIDDL